MDFLWNYKWQMEKNDKIQILKVTSLWDWEVRKIKIKDDRA